MNEETKNVIENEEDISVENTADDTPVEEDVSDKESEIEEDETEKTIAELNGQIADLTDQVNKLKNAYAMAYADTENTRKRLQKDFEQRSKYSMQPFALELLPVLDNCERALAQETQDEAYRKGVEMIYSQLKAALEKEGIVEIEAEGQPFDGNWHQALMSEQVDGVEPGMVTQVLQKGYKLKDRILRAAMVKISE